MHNCNYCSLKTDNRIVFHLHNMEHHKDEYYDDIDEEFKCHLCDYSGGIRGANIHFGQKHSDEYDNAKNVRPEIEGRECEFVCTWCDEPTIYKDQHYLNLHRSREHSERYEVYEYLTAVEDARSKKFTCEECDPPKGYKQKNWYQKHMREEHPDVWNEIKTNEANEHDYVCDICEPPKGFDTERALNIHTSLDHEDEWHETKQQRADEKEYQCFFCDEPNGFDDNSGFHNHLWKMHPEEMKEFEKWVEVNKPYQCHECDEIKGFDTERGLHQHQGLEHGGSLIDKECTICDTVFAVKPSLVDIVKTCGKDYCQSKQQSNVISGENHPFYIDGDNPYYGRGWSKIADEVRECDDYTCQKCGMTQEEHFEKYGRKLDVDHLIPLRWFKEQFKGDYWEVANLKINLKTFCRSCHRKVELNKDY